MKKALLFLAAAALLAPVVATAQNAAAPAAPQSAAKPIESLALGSAIPMPTVVMPNAQSGKGPTSLLAENTGKGLLVMFSCNTCPYVVKSEARTKEMIAYAREKGLGVVIVNSNEAQRQSGEDAFDAMRAYATRMGYTVPYLLDEKSALADAFGATRTPEVFLFDTRGMLVYKGAMEDNPANPAESKKMYLRAAIDAVLSRKAPDPATTKSIGCSIKRAS